MVAAGVMAKKQAPYRNRIIEYGVKPADQFLAHPKNARVHPQIQREAMKSALDTVGFVAPVLEAASGYLVDGHERVWDALENGNAPVPYVKLDISEDEENYVLATLDPIGALATYDAAKLDELLASVNSDSPAIQEMLAAIAEGAFTLPDDSLSSDDAPLTAYDVPDALWPTDNEWDVPVLDIKLQADAVDLPVNVWGADGRKSRMNGTYHFYTDDYRFNNLWDDPTPIINAGCVNIVEPNYSTNAQMPKAVVLWFTYRKRWLARYWQSKGIRVFVDLDVHESLSEINLMGVPQGWRAYACYGRQQDHTLADVERMFTIACERRGSDDVLFLVIGGEKDFEDWCKRTPQAVWCPAFEQTFYRNTRQMTVI